MKIENTRFFVTGGAGFIGSHIVESLVRKGGEVTVYDNFSFGCMENLGSCADHVTVIEGDILDYNLLHKSMAGHDVVSHHAAQLEIFLSVERPERDLEINTVGTLNVLRAARSHGVRKVINASSACIYGQTEESVEEDHLPVPNWSYGVSKLAAERYGTIYSTYHDLPVVNLRYGITYGEREWFRRVLTIFIKRAILKQTLVVFGDGEQIRDFIYVGDAVRLHNMCIQEDAADGESYNVGTGRAISINDLAISVAQVSHAQTGFMPEILHEDTAEGTFSELVPDKKRNPAELKVMLLDCAKATSQLGWSPEVSLESGVARELIWAQDHLARWECVHYSND